MRRQRWSWARPCRWHARLPAIPHPCQSPAAAATACPAAPCHRPASSRLSRPTAAWVPTAMPHRLAGSPVAALGFSRLVMLLCASTESRPPSRHQASNSAASSGTAECRNQGPWALALTCAAMPSWPTRAPNSGHPSAPVAIDPLAWQEGAVLGPARAAERAVIASEPAAPPCVVARSLQLPPKNARQLPCLLGIQRQAG